MLLAGCSDNSRPSSLEDEQLDNAAEMLNSAPAALEGVDENELRNAKQEADGAG